MRRSSGRRVIRVAVLFVSAFVIAACGSAGTRSTKDDGSQAGSASWTEAPGSLGNSSSAAGLFGGNTLGSYVVIGTNSHTYQTISPNIAGALVVAGTGVGAVLSDPEPGHSEGVVALVFQASTPQHDLTPASTQLYVQSFDAATGDQMTSAVLSAANDFRLEYTDGTVVSGVQTDGSNSETLQAFSLKTGQSAWSGPTWAPVGDSNRDRVVDGEFYGLVPTNTHGGVCSFAGIDAASGKTLFSVVPAEAGLTDDNCAGNTGTMQSLGNGEAVFIADGSASTARGYVIAEHSGTLVSGAPTLGNNVEADGRGSLVASVLQDGSLAIYDRAEHWKQVASVPASQANSVGLYLAGVCDGDIYVSTNTQQLVLDGRTGATKAENWTATPLSCGSGWAITEGLPNTGSTTDNQSRYFVLHSGASVLSQQGGLPQATTTTSTSTQGSNVDGTGGR